jgi:hypothetical protein
LGLQAKLAIQTARGDPGAADTALELQMERLDNVPGNTSFKEIYENVIDIIGKNTDEVAKISATIARLGTDVEIDADGLIRFGADVTADAIEEVVEDLRAIPGRSVWVSNGKIYVNTPTKTAIEAVTKLKVAVKAGADEDTIVRLIDEVAVATTHGEGNRMVLGAWQAGSGYIGDAVENGGVFFDTGDEVWKILEQCGIDPWRVNQAYMRRQLEAGIQEIEFVGDDIYSVINSTDERIRNSYRAKEIRWLLENASNYGYKILDNNWVNP